LLRGIVWGEPGRKPSGMKLDPRIVWVIPTTPLEESSDLGVGCKNGPLWLCGSYGVLCGHIRDAVCQVDRRGDGETIHVGVDEHKRVCQGS